LLPRDGDSAAGGQADRGTGYSGRTQGRGGDRSVREDVLSAWKSGGSDVPHVERAGRAAGELRSCRGRQEHEISRSARGLQAIVLRVDRAVRAATAVDSA